MKFIVIVGDGMADYPSKRLNGKTPLEVANKPNLDLLAKEGKMGLLKTIPEKMPPDSSVANLSILGYDPVKCYTGRGPLEAGAMGIKLGEEDVAFRCNLVTVKDGILSDYSSGHITTEEAAILLDEMRKLGIGEYFLGKSYRHVFVLRNSDAAAGCSPPHDIVGEPISKHMIKDGEVGEKLNRLMLRSLEILSHHPVNLRRVSAGKNPGNMIWLWSPGKRPRLEPFQEKFGLRGGLISAVPLIKGIGVYAQMEPIDVPGATGYYDTNYEGKADYAVKFLEKNDFIFIHVEAPDEAGHEGDPEKKVKTIEDLDRRLIGRILNRVSEVKIAVLPDHPTPVDVRLHMRDPVPFVIWREGMEGDGLTFCEASGRLGSLGFLEGEQFMEKFLKI
ncbi:MAG: cofactor-independent phosphoglycerate mutase [Candidatus Hadarchaeales archaeon]